jgi:hypothetical protein
MNSSWRECNSGSMIARPSSGSSAFSKLGRALEVGKQRGNGLALTVSSRRRINLF